MTQSAQAGKSSKAEYEIGTESDQLDQAARLGIKPSHCKLLPGQELLRTTGLGATLGKGSLFKPAVFFSCRNYLISR